MKVAVVNLTAGSLSGGYRKYLKRLVPLLREQPGVTSVDVHLPDTAADALRGSAVEPFTTWDARTLGWAARPLRERIRASAPDVVFVPTARWEDFGVPTVVMVRNMEPLTAPLRGNSVSEASRNVARRLVARRACRRADGVVAVSEFVRDFVEREWRVDGDRLGVVYHGVDRAEQGERPRTLAALERPFLFTAGSIRPARGLEDAIRALGELRRRGRPQTLVVAGEATPGSFAHGERLRELAASLGVADDVVWAGLLSPAEMAWCFDHCRAFVMTSRMEACPNLVLEALAHGCLNVSTSSRPMPEFFRDSAWYYAPGDAASLAGAIGSALAADPDDAADRRAVGRARASEFSWAATAAGTVGMLQRAVARGQGGARRSA